MPRILVVLVILAGCATTEQQPGVAQPGLEPLTLSPSGAPMGRDNPIATYLQPSLGPERRIEPPPAPRRP